MRVELFPFQKRALADIRMKTAEAMGSYHRTHTPQVISFTAPTGAGKTIIMASLIESIFFGDESIICRTAERYRDLAFGLAAAKRTVQIED